MSTKKIQDLLSPLEDIWMEKNIINTYVVDESGQIQNILFKIENTSTGFLFALELTVTGITGLSDDARESILDKLEALTDDIGEDFLEYGLNIDDLEDVRLDLVVE